MPSDSARHRLFIISFSFPSVVVLIFLFFNWHCQITITFHPSCFKSAIFLLSHLVFDFIFCFQNSRLVDGNFPAKQLCPCQKQPFIKITTLYLGSTMSGVPGYRLSFFLYRYPLANKYFLTRISCFESLGPILPIIFDLLSDVKVSVNMKFYMLFYIHTLYIAKFRW